LLPLAIGKARLVRQGARVPASSLSTPDQSGFLECYRGRQGALHHLAYMRMSKVLLALELCRRDVFDYGFGAGTFFRHCPREARLFGVEMDPENVAAVRAMLADRGRQADLQPIDIARWAEHPLLARQYDVILCSHVLEHLPDPANLLKRLGQCLHAGGSLIGLVPINERVMDVHHVQRLDESKIRAFGEAAGLSLAVYVEADPWLYWIQPLWTREGGLRHGVAQGISLGLGLVASALGPRLWDAAGRVWRPLTGARFTQAAFVFTCGD
jgi:SAM-dependent methyltransferase